MRKTLYFYLLREQIIPVLICLAGVSFVMITGQLIQVRRILFASSCTLADVGIVILLAMPKLSLYTIPMASMLGVMLGFARLNSDNELIALKAAGTGCLEFLPSTATILGFATFIAFFNAIFLIPFANDALEFKIRSIGRTSIPALIKEGAFISSVPKLVFFFKSVDHSDLTMKGVFIQDQRHPKERVTISAEQARLVIPPDSKTITFHVNNGVITRIAENLGDAQAVSFKNYDFTLSVDDLMGALTRGLKGRKDMTLEELAEQIRKAADKATKAYYAIEMHERLAFPAACLMLGLLGPPLGALFRQSLLTGVTLGILVFLSYYVLLSGGKSLGENHLLPPLLAVWLPNLLCFSLAIYLWSKMHTEKPSGLLRFEPLLRRALAKSGLDRGLKI